MLFNKQGKEVEVSKGVSPYILMQYLEKKLPDTKYNEVPGGLFELGKRVKYGKRGCAPQEQAVECVPNMSYRKI